MGRGKRRDNGDGGGGWSGSRGLGGGRSGGILATRGGEALLLGMLAARTVASEVIWCGAIDTEFCGHATLVFFRG